MFGSPTEIELGLFSSFMSWISGASSRTKGIQVLDPISGRMTTRTVNAETALQLSAVFACVRLIAETIAGLPLNFYEVQAGGAKKLITQHPLQNLLMYKPNRYQTKVEFFETLIFQLALHGNSYHLKTLSGKDIVSLMPIMTPQVQTEIIANGDVIHRYSDGTNISVYSEKSIWHNKLFGNGVIGISPLGCARNSLGIAMSAEDRVNKMANSGFRPAGVLTIDKVLSPEQRKAIREQFKDLADGGNDSLRVLEAGLAYQQISMNPKDVQLLESRKFQTEDIARFFGVPSVLINDTSASTVWGSGVSEIIRGFYKLGLSSYLGRIESSIVINLLDISERRNILPEFDFEVLMKGDEKTRFEAYQTSIRSGVKTPNECRREEGLPPDQDGNRLFIDGQLVFLKDGGKGNVKAPITNP